MKNIQIISDGQEHETVQQMRQILTKLDYVAERGYTQDSINKANRFFNAHFGYDIIKEDTPVGPHKSGVDTLSFEKKLTGKQRQILEMFVIAAHPRNMYPACQTVNGLVVPFELSDKMNDFVFMEFALPDTFKKTYIKRGWRLKNIPVFHDREKQKKAIALYRKLGYSSEFIPDLKMKAHLLKQSDMFASA